MTDQKNIQLRLARRPSGEAQIDDFELTEDPIPIPSNGEILVRSHYLSVDPSSRTHWNEGQSYRGMVQLGEVIDIGVAGEVVESKHDSFRVGDFVAGPMGIQEYGVVHGDLMTVCDMSVAPLPSWLGGLYMTGLTAYFGLLDTGAPKPQETVLVTAASGAVGMVVGQIARAKGARAVGTAGSEEKCRYLVEELGFDAAINYKSESFYLQLREATPERIDVIFDNVGGPLLDTVMRRLAIGGRIVVCGATSQYNNDVIRGPTNYLALATMRAKMEGFIIFDYEDRYSEAREEMIGWMKTGQLKFRENIIDGEVADYPRILHRLYEGENIGKMMLRLPTALAVD
jgi:NADPH-dependent curcumin reductase CurA